MRDNPGSLLPAMQRCPALAVALCPPGPLQAQDFAGSGVQPATRANSEPRPIAFADGAPGDAALVIVTASAELAADLPLSGAERAALTAAIAAEGFEGKVESKLSLRGVGPRPRLLVVGVGADAQGLDYAKAAGSAAQELRNEKAPVAMVGLPSSEAAATAGTQRVTWWLGRRAAGFTTTGSGGGGRRGRAYQRPGRGSPRTQTC